MKRQASVARTVQLASQLSGSYEHHDWAGKLDHSLTLTGSHYSVRDVK